MRRLLFSLCALLGLSAALSSCQPDPIAIDLPAHQPRLVISSLLGTVRDSLIGIEDSVLLVTVSRSADARSSAGAGGNTTNGTSLADSATVAGLLVDHCRVVLSGGNMLDTLLPLGNGVYMLFSPQLRGDTPYQLAVYDSASQLTCQAQTHYLPKMTFAALRPILTRTDHDTTVELEYSLRDKPGRSFYMVQVTSTRAATGSLNVRDASSVLQAAREQQRLRLLSDNDFRDGVYTLREKLPVKANDTLIVGVAQVSEDYFRFLQAYRKAGKLFNQISGEPINYPTNVQNGYGFFNLHSLSVQLVDLSR